MLHDLARVLILGGRLKARSTIRWKRRYDPQIGPRQYQRTLRVLNGVTSETRPPPPRRGVSFSRAIGSRPRYYFNVNVLAIVTKINNNAYVTGM